MPAEPGRLPGYGGPRLGADALVSNAESDYTRGSTLKPEMAGVFAPNRYYLSPFEIATGGFPAAQLALFPLAPLEMVQTLHVCRLRVVTALGGSTIRIGLYQYDGRSAPGWFRALTNSFVTCPGDSAGMQTKALPGELTLQPGAQYFLGRLSSSLMLETNRLEFLEPTVGVLVYPLAVTSLLMEIPRSTVTKIHSGTISVPDVTFLSNAANTVV